MYKLIQTYMELCGILPIFSNKVHRYIYGMYIYDINNILDEPMKNRGDVENFRLFIDLAEKITTRGFKPKFNILDNKASDYINNTTAYIGVNHQIVLTLNQILSKA